MWLEISKLRMRDFEIAQRILQTAQVGKYSAQHYDRMKAADIAQQSSINQKGNYNRIVVLG